MLLNIQNNNNNKNDNNNNKNNNNIYKITKLNNKTINEISGEGGFGFDPIFIPNDLDENGDALEFGPTRLEVDAEVDYEGGVAEDSQKDAVRKLGNRLKFGADSILYFPFIYGGLKAVGKVGKEVKVFYGKSYILEEAYKADFSIVKAWKGDETGNLIFRGTARNFNPMMCGAGNITIAEVENLVPTGQLDPNMIHVPGIFVDRIFQGKKFQKRIEQLTIRKK